jgi:lysophospholipase L1-like esterase
MSFGDSVTEGKTSTFQGILTGSSSTTFPGSYPQILEEKLSARYLDQIITVIADGSGGKRAADDDRRLGAELTIWNPDVLLLQEGANDLLDPNGPEIGSAAEGLETMVRDAKAHRARVFLGTVLGMNPGAPKSTVSRQAADAVPRLNDLIKAIAVRQNVTLVDLNSAVPLSAIGDDGVHPRPLGEEIIADEFLKAVIATMEVSPSTP